MREREIKGECHGVRITERPAQELHGKMYHPAPILRLLSEDDEFWSDTDMTFDVGWIDDLVKVLLAAKAVAQGWQASDKKTKKSK